VRLRRVHTLFDDVCENSFLRCNTEFFRVSLGCSGFFLSLGYMKSNVFDSVTFQESQEKDRKFKHEKKSAEA